MADEAQPSGHDMSKGAASFSTQRTTHLSQDVELRGLFPSAGRTKQAPQELHHRLQSKAHKSHGSQDAHDLPKSHCFEQSSDDFGASLLKSDVCCEPQQHSQEHQAGAQYDEEGGQVHRLEAL